MQEKKSDEKALSPEEVARRYGLSMGSLANLRCMGKGPRYYKVGRKVIYTIRDIEDWIFKNPVQTTDSHNLKV